MAAPSAANQQPWEFFVVTNKEKLEELSRSTPYAGCTKNASVAFVPCYRKDTKYLAYAQIDMSASVENLLLEADILFPKQSNKIDLKKSEYTIFNKI